MDNVPKLVQKLWRQSLPIVLFCITVILFHKMANADPAENLPYYVRYETGNKLIAINQIENLGGVVNHELDRWNLLSVSLPGENLKRLDSISAASSMEPIPSYELTGEEYPFGLDLVQALDVWDFDRDGMLDPGAPIGSGIKVCVIDTGVIDSHKDLSATTINGFSQINGEAWNETTTGHGTHVAGIVAANMQGIGLAGVAPGVELFIVKVYNSSGAWVNGQSNVGAAAATCAENGADIINLSLKSDNRSDTEEAIFQSLYEDDGILTIAAAANDGSSTGSEDGLAYPASYDSVVSVAAITSALTHASYSNENDQVELAAPGSAVLSTWPSPNDGSIPYGKVIDNENTHPGMYIENSAQGSASSTLIDGGLCLEDDLTDDWNGKIVLCQRQVDSFSTMVTNTENKGAAGTIIVWIEEGLMVGQLGSGPSSNPVVMVGLETGDYLKNNKLGTVVTVETHDGSNFLVGPGGYRGLRGTSMASPHVAGVAALVWSVCPDLNNQELRQLLSDTALDLGTPDRDFSFGNGLVQAFDAWHHCQPADLGDLPRSYGLIRHTGNGDLKLGDLWAENSWQGAYPGTGHDDKNDDGVSITDFSPGGLATAAVMVKGQAQTPWITGWMDYNRDGKFSSVEEIVNDPVAINSITEFTFTVPITVEISMPINFRFRVYDSGITNLNRSQSINNLPATLDSGEGEDGSAANIPTAVAVSRFDAAGIGKMQFPIIPLALIISVASLYAVLRSHLYRLKPSLPSRSQQAAISPHSKDSGSQL